MSINCCSFCDHNSLCPLWGGGTGSFGYGWATACCLGKKRVNVMKVKAKLLILCSADQILQGTSWLRLDCLLLWVCRSYNIKCQWSGKQMHFRNRCLWYPFAPAMDLQLESCSGITLMHQVCLLLSLDLGLKASPGLACPHQADGPSSLQTKTSITGTFNSGDLIHVTSGFQKEFVNECRSSI